jgi:DNA-binding XRE family transcriptional regulator
MWSEPNRDLLQRVRNASIGTDSQRVSRYENERITPSLDAIVRIAEAFNVSIDYLLVDDIPRRPLHSAEHSLGDHLAHVGELSEDDLAALVNVLDGLVAKTASRPSPAGSADQPVRIGVICTIHPSSLE